MPPGGAASRAGGTELDPVSRTDPLMPKAARPIRTHPARAQNASAARAPVTAATAAATASAGTLPSGWGAAAPLLLEQSAALGTRAPINVNLLNSATGAATANVALSAIWTLPAQPGRSAARIAIRRLDPKGRLMLPMQLTEEVKIDLPAECDGPVLTLFLPGAKDRLAIERCVAPLSLDSRGRLSVGQATRTQIGWDAGSDILIAFDADAHTLTLTAASAVESAVLSAMDALRPSTRSEAGSHVTAEAIDATPDENVHYLPSAGVTKHQSAARGTKSTH